MTQKNDNNIPKITPGDMARIDDIAINEIGLPLLQMMENAGKTLAKIAIKNYKPSKVTILCGKGNNGGGGLVCARYLKNYGLDVNVILAEDNLRETPKHQHRIATHIGIPIYSWSHDNKLIKIIQKSNLIIDALLGYNAKGKPKQHYEEIIWAVNESGQKVLSLDVPTGLDLRSGTWHEPSLKHADVATLALPFKYLVNNEYIGKIYLIDLGIPRVSFITAGKSFNPTIFDLNDYLIIKK